MGLGEMLEFIGDGPSQKFTSSLIKNIKCKTHWFKYAQLEYGLGLIWRLRQEGEGGSGKADEVGEVA